MSSDQPTDHLIELIYGELSDEEETSLRESIAESAEMRAELNGFEQLLDALNDTVEVVDVPDGLHASIMTAAREAAASAVEDEARAIRRPPAAATDGRGMWSRIRGSQFPQVALVATVLLAGAFVFRFVSFDATPGQIAYEERPAMESAVADTESAPSAPVAAPMVEQKVAEEPALLDRTTETAAEEMQREVAGPTAGSPDGQGRQAADAPNDVRPEVIARPQSTRSSKAAGKKSIAKRKPAPRPKPSKRPASKKEERSKGTLELLNEDKNVWDGAGSNKSAPAQEPAAAPTPVAAAEDSEAAPAKDEFRPADGSLDAVQENYNRGDYRATIAQADKVMTSSATASDKARALELKAQSYSRMGMFSQADSAYRNLQANYPNYNVASVRSAREEIARRLNEKREEKKSPAKRKAKSYDFEDEALSPSLE